MYMEANQIQPLMGKDLGSGFFPKIVGVSILIVSLIQLVAVIKKPIIESENKDKEPEDSKVGYSPLQLLLRIQYYMTFWDLYVPQCCICSFKSIY